MTNNPAADLAEVSLQLGATSTSAGGANPKLLFAELASAGLADKVTVANLSVFGRPLATKGTSGRHHSLNRPVMMISGSNVGPGVFGGIKESGSDSGATATNSAIDSATGIGTDDGDIPEDEILELAAKTLSSIFGISTERADHRIEGDRVIEPAIAP